MKATGEELLHLKKALNQKDQLFEQDKTEIWNLRHEVCSNPDLQHFLTRVLQSVKWNCYVDVAKVNSLFFSKSSYLFYHFLVFPGMLVIN